MLDSVDDDLEGRVLHKLVINCLRKRRVSKSRKIECRTRRWCRRKSWDKLSAALTEQKLCQYFRMSCECFDLLCTKIKINVGEGGFQK